MVPSPSPVPAAASPKARLESAWESFFARLLEFKRQHGHFSVPTQVAEHCSLGWWVARQRTRLAAGTMSPERRERLAAAGFPGESGQRLTANRTWDRHFAELMAFHRQHGHFRLPRADPDYKLLWEWMHHMRRKKRAGRLQPDREQRLTAARFPWSPPLRPPRLPAAPKRGRPVQTREQRAEASWEKSFAKLQAFHLANGHFNVPDGIYHLRGSFILRSWIMLQRRLYSLGRQPPERVRRLTALGFPWDLPPGEAQPGETDLLNLTDSP